MWGKGEKEKRISESQFRLTIVILPSKAQAFLCLQFLPHCHEPRLEGCVPGQNCICCCNFETSRWATDTRACAWSAQSIALVMYSGITSGMGRSGTSVDRLVDGRKYEMWVANYGDLIPERCDGRSSTG